MMHSPIPHPFVYDDEDDDESDYENQSNVVAPITVPKDALEPLFPLPPPPIVRSNCRSSIAPVPLAPTGTTVYSTPYGKATALASEDGETIEFRREKRHSRHPPQPQRRKTSGKAIQRVDSKTKRDTKPTKDPKPLQKDTSPRQHKSHDYGSLAELRDRITFVPDHGSSGAKDNEILYPRLGKEVVSRVESALPLVRACDYAFADDLPSLTNHNGNPFALSFTDRSFVNCVQEYPEPPIPGVIRNGNVVETVRETNQSPAVLGVDNSTLFDFLRDCSGRRQKVPMSKAQQRPSLDQVIRQEHATIADVHPTDLLGDQCDFQGVDWTAMNTERSTCRRQRLQTYHNYVNREGSDQWSMCGPDADMSTNESFFRFKRMAIRKDVKLAHFQLRSVLACPSRAHAYFPGPKGVYHFNTALRQTEQFLTVRDIAANDDVVSSLDARHGVMVCGLFNGDYLTKSLDSTDPEYVTRCRVSKTSNGITNHIKLFQGRHSSRPLAAIASNDKALRLFDVGSQELVRETEYPFAINCTALSPDRRRRAVVGDDFNLLITEEESGKVLQKLPGHRDYVFSCDWADNDWHVATGSQDMAVRIWDARRWTDNNGNSLPLCTFKTDMAGARTVRFSPSGGGTPVLVAAEEADIVNVIETRNFKSRQKLDVFAEIAGIDFTDDGRGLNVLCCDPHRGGLLELERCGGGAAFLHRAEKTWQKWNNLADYDMPIGV